MELMIGTRIKQLRKERGMTQEYLAELVGISFQAISKWENNMTLPDITLIPKLARIFGVTTDDLFAYNLEERQKKIEEYIDKSYRFRETNIEQGRKILEEGLKEFPDDEVLLNNLLYVMDYTKNPDETIKIASKVIDKATMGETKYDALRFLAYAYDAKGDKKSAVAALEQIPEIYFTKLSEMAYVLEGKEKLEVASKQKWISFETLIQMMWKMAEVYEEEGNLEEAIKETKEAISLIELFCDTKEITNFEVYKLFFKKQLERMCKLQSV